MKTDNVQLMFDNAFIIEKLENIRKSKKKIKMKFFNFETSIDSFHRFSSKKSINENVNNSKSKNQFLSFNNDLTKTFIKLFRSFFNDFDETLFFDNFFEKNIITKIAFRY